MGNRSKVLAAIGCLAAGAGVMPVAVAQEDAGAGGLEEIVITARKRVETLIEVPVAVAVLTAEDIEQRGVRNLQDVALFTPGLSYFDAIQNQLGTPVIRGLSQTNLNSPDRNVAVFYGGVYLSNLNATNLEILDVERIEVVKGPQSALYGRNAFNGAINYVPASPTKTFKSTLTATVGTDERREGRLMVSGPIGELMRGRVAVSYNKFDGSWENAADPDDNLGGYETKNLSAVLEFEPNDKFNARLFGYKTDDTRDGSATYFAPGFTCGPTLPSGPTLTAICGDVPVRSSLAANPDDLAFSRNVTLASLDLAYDFGPVSLKAQVSRYEAKTDNFSDSTLGEANGAGYLYNIATSAAPTVILRQQRVPYFIGSGKGRTDTDSAELRLESRQDGAARWMLGVFQYKNSYNNLQRVVFDGRGLAAGEIPLDAFAFGRVPGCVDYTAPVNSAGMCVAANLEREDKQKAYFASGELDVTEQVTLGAELRWDEEDRQQYSVAAPATSLQKGEFDYSTWRVHADFELNPSQRFYVSAAKGVISGYFNPTNDAVAMLPVPADLQAYDPAINKTYEIGWKAEWLDRRLTSELALFYIDYTNIQISASPPPPLITNLIQNLVGATSKGFELSLNYSVTEQWRVGMTYSYSPTEFDEGAFDPGVARYCGGTAGLAAGFCPSLTFRGVLQPDVSGEALPRSPNRLASAYFSFDTKLSGEWEFYARGDASYTGRASVLSLPLTTYAPRTLVNARVGVRKGPLDVALWGRNIFDKEYVNAVINQPPNGPAGTPLRFLPNISQGEKATFGLTATYSFGE